MKPHFSLFMNILNLDPVTLKEISSNNSITISELKLQFTKFPLPDLDLPPRLEEMIDSGINLSQTFSELLRYGFYYNTLLQDDRSFIPTFPVLQLELWCTKQEEARWPSLASLRYLLRCTQLAIRKLWNDEVKVDLIGTGLEQIHAGWEILCRRLAGDVLQQSFSLNKHYRSASRDNRILEVQHQSLMLTVSSSVKCNNFTQLLGLLTKDSVWEHAIGHDQPFFPPPPRFPRLTEPLLKLIARKDVSILLLIGHVYPALDMIIFDRDSNNLLHVTFVQCKYTDKDSPLDLETVVNALRKTLRDWAPLVSSEKDHLLPAFKELASQYYQNMTPSKNKAKDWKPYDSKRADANANTEYQNLIASRKLSGPVKDVARVFDLAGTNVHFVIVSFMAPKGSKLQSFMAKGRDGLRILGKEQLRSMYGPVLYSRIQPLSIHYNSDNPDENEGVASSPVEASVEEEEEEEGEEEEGIQLADD